MSRGRGRGAGAGAAQAQAASPRSTNAAPATPTPEAEIGGVFLSSALEIDRLIDAKVDEALDPELSAMVYRQQRYTYRGGVSGDTTRPASDLLAAAIDASAGDAASCERALEILDRAEAHQRAYLARLKAAAAEPRKRLSYEMWKAAEVRSTDPRAHERLVGGATDLLERIAKERAMLIDGALSEELAKRRTQRRESLGFSKLVEAKSNVLLASSLADEDHARTRALLEAYQTLGTLDKDEEPLTDKELVLAGRVQRAQAAIGEGDKANWTIGIRRVTPERIAAMSSHRAGGDEIEKWVHQSNHGGVNKYEDPQIIPTAEDAGQVLARARAMARIPARFRARGYNSADTTKTENAELVIPATVDGLKDFLEHAKAGGYFHDLALVDEAVTRKGGKRELSLQVRMAAALADQDVLLSARLSLGTTNLTNRDSQMRWLMDDVAPGLGIEEMIGKAVPQEDQDYSFRAVRGPAIRDFPTRLRGVQPARSLTQMIGEDRCAHANATWQICSEQAYGATRRPPDTGRLSCPDCLRTRVSVQPLHRFPAGHPILSQIKEEDYLPRERYYAELRGDRRPISSIAQLRERDGLVNLNPSAYAAGMPNGAKPPSIAAAMNRR